MFAYLFAFLLFGSEHTADESATFGKIPAWGGGSAAYQIRLDRDIKHGGNASASLQYVNSDRGFGSLIQAIEAKAYRGKRIKFSAYIRTSEVEDSAGLWLRVDSTGGLPIVFDNMSSRPIQGTNDWTQATIIVDVPAESASITFGALLNGKGTIWIDDVELVEVDGNQEVTAEQIKATKAVVLPFLLRLATSLRNIPNAPRNLDFETEPSDASSNPQPK